MTCTERGSVHVRLDVLGVDVQAGVEAGLPMGPRLVLGAPLGLGPKLYVDAPPWP